MPNMFNLLLFSIIDFQVDLPTGAYLSEVKSYSSKYYKMACCMIRSSRVLELHVKDLMRSSVCTVFSYEIEHFLIMVDMKSNRILWFCVVDRYRMKSPHCEKL